MTYPAIAEDVNITGGMLLLPMKPRFTSLGKFYNGIKIGEIIDQGTKQERYRKDEKIF